MYVYVFYIGLCAYVDLCFISILPCGCTVVCVFMFVYLRAVYVDLCFISVLPCACIVVCVFMFVYLRVLHGVDVNICIYYVWSHNNRSFVCMLCVYDVLNM